MAAAEALSHAKWEPGECTLSQQELWDRIREEAREVAAEGAAREAAALLCMHTAAHRPAGTLAGTEPTCRPGLS